MLLLKKYRLSMVFSLLGLIFFFVFSYAPMLSGDQPDAAKHAVTRAQAEQAAVRFVSERIGGGSLSAFGMYAAERDVFGYFDKNEVIDDVMTQFRASLPLEAYRVEVKEIDTGTVYLIDINPYTGEPSEWNIPTGGEGLPRGDLLQAGNEMLERLGLTPLQPKLVSADGSLGEIVYDVSNPLFLEAGARITLHVDSLGPASVDVQWSVPEHYSDLVARQDMLANVLGTTGLLLSGVLQFAALIYVLAQIKHVRLSRGIVMALVFGVIYCGININMYPGIKAMLLDIINGGSYPPPSGEEGGIMAGLISALLVTNALTMALAIGLYFSAVAGDALSARQGWRIWPRWADSDYGRHTAAAVWKGYLFAPVMLGLQSIIYIGAETGFRTWYTIDALTSANNMLYPIFLPLLAWCAALSEEAVYRLFGIAALKRLVRYTFPAVLLSSMIWSLGHVQYPIYPYYTRFVEVTIIGLLFAYIFLKHGFLTAVFTHAVVDIIWMGIAITANAPTAPNWIAFAFYMAVPAVIGLAVQSFHRSRHGGAPPTPA
jgi:hypothetical protein